MFCLLLEYLKTKTLDTLTVEAKGLKEFLQLNRIYDLNTFWSKAVERFIHVLKLFSNTMKANQELLSFVIYSSTVDL